MEGIESYIMAIGNSLELCSSLNIKSIEIGMFHRGRLHLMNNLSKIKPSIIFSDIEKNNPELH